MVGTGHTLMTYAMHWFYCCHAGQGAGWLPHAPSRIPALSREIIWLLRTRTSTAQWIYDIRVGLVRCDNARIVLDVLPTRD